MVDPLFPSTRVLSASSCYPTIPTPETGPAPGPFTYQVTSRILIRPGKISRTNWSENKANFIQVEEKKEARARVNCGGGKKEQKQKVGPGGRSPTCEGGVPALTLK